MPGYDPRRSRPRPAVAPVDDSAPVDALLGPDPVAPSVADPAPVSGDDAIAPRVAPSNTDAGPRAAWPPPASGRGAPAPLMQLAPLAVLGALVLLVLVLWERRRR
ncbi:MAG: hypothetical protein ACXIVQ_12560 [Acidimicrobiales bacterium]